MRDTFLMLFGGLLFLALMACLAKVVENQQAPKPLETTPRLIDCDPEFFKDRLVRLKTEGFESGEQTNELRFRRRTDQPYVVLLKFKSKVPDKLPEFVTGTCQGRINGTVVIDCR